MLTKVFVEPRSVAAGLLAVVRYCSVVMLIRRKWKTSRQRKHQITSSFWSRLDHAKSKAMMMGAGAAQATALATWFWRRDELPTGTVPHTKKLSIAMECISLV